MKRVNVHLVLLCLVLVGCERKVERIQPPASAATPSITFGPTPNPNLIDWEGRAKQIQIGTRRAEVERLLPEYWRPPITVEDRRRFGTVTVGVGGGQSVSYRVSETVTVIVSYDYTGVPRDALGTATGYSSPENRVVAPVRIQHESK